ncbi:unnamed protein product [Caenorhabditis auriculariae]|uniref:Uncharacterized protein n=1 Tax=Caenorhabditis auriculariae TaxID=2777116 RepID=A0A8S1HFX9_9PELO|nr:unnamed protein product [Caenorhabditis auriculariae]
MSKRRLTEMEYSKEHTCEVLREKVHNFRLQKEQQLYPIFDQIMELESFINGKMNEFERVGDEVIELQNSGAPGHEIEWKRNQRDCLRNELNALRDRKNIREQELSQKRQEIDQQVQILLQKLERGETF